MTQAPGALTILAGYTGQEVADHLAMVIVWNDDSAGDAVMNTGNVHLIVTCTRRKIHNSRSNRLSI